MKYQTITNSSGAIVETLSFDPWGRRRNAVNWSYTGAPTTFLFDRGYTGHEHLDKFGLINMNGRVYDPYTAHFLSPDNYVQAPGFTQSYNRYAYCLNNPLKYTDPSGYFSWPKFWKTAATVVVGVVVTVVVAAAIVASCGTAAIAGAAFLGAMAGGFASGVTGAALNGGDFIDCMGAGMIGMQIAAVMAGIGGALGGIPMQGMAPGSRTTLGRLCSNAFGSSANYVGASLAGATGGSTSSLVANYYTTEVYACSYSLNQSASSGRTYSNVGHSREFMNVLARKNFGNIPGLGNVYGNGEVPAKSTTYLLNGIYITKDGPAWGFTNGNDIYISPGAQQAGIEQCLSTIGHELVHVLNFNKGLDVISPAGRSQTEYAAWSYVETLARDMGWESIATNAYNIIHNGHPMYNPVEIDPSYHDFSLPFHR